MSAFAAEVKAANSKSTPPPPVAPAKEAAAQAAPTVAEAAPAAASETSINASDILNTGLPTGSAPIEGEVQVQEAAPKAQAQDTPADKEAPPKIRIAGKEFASMQEAIEYAEALELAKREDDAFKEGFKEAKKGDEKPAPPKKSYIEEAEELLFEDPKKALELVREGVRKEIFEAYDKMTSDQKAEQARQEQLQNLWTSFYAENTDLAEAKDYVDYVLKKNWDKLANKPTAQSLPELAEIARLGLKITKQSALPSKELPNKPATMAGANGYATGTQAPATAKKDVDFISQLNTIRKRK